MRCWLNGEPCNGSWDMGGATKQAPVVDAAPVWIGSSLAGNAASSFHGELDGVAVYRASFSQEKLAEKARYHGPPRERRIPTPRLPRIGKIPQGRVLLSLEQGITEHKRWPKRSASLEQIKIASLSQFYLPQLPFNYDDWGIRDDWPTPLVATLASDVALPSGKHRLVVRTRGLSRLWVDGELVVQTPPHNGASDGHGPVLPVPKPPRTGLEPVGYGDHENLVEIIVPGDTDERRDVRVVLESILGGKNLRAEPGEMPVGD